jgi:cytoskeleton protein RodZ
MSVFGDTLRQARAQRGVTLRQAEQETRINRHYLAAFEDEAFENLPALPYQRGIVRTYAAYLGLDQSRLVELFEDARGARPEDPPRINTIEPIEMPSHWAPNFAIIAFTLIAGAVVFAWLYSAYFQTSPSAETVVSLQPTVTRVSDDAIFAPSPTPDLPTPTPTLPPSPVPTETPVLTAVAASAHQGAQPIESTKETTQTSGGEAVSSGIVQVLPQELPDDVAAIMVTALSDIYVQIAADGVLYFEGSLAEGQSTDWVVGSDFSVYTNSGVNTQFTNHQGTKFLMGAEPGEVVYSLSGRND